MSSEQMERELLELAAKAAGVSGEWCDCNDHEPGILTPNDSGRVWNPLADDGDALRLATTLRLEIRPCWLFVEVESGISVEATRCVDTDDSRNAATRYAITRAAAQLAKGEGK